MSSSPGASARVPESTSSAGRRLRELLTLCALAFSAPLFAVLADGPEFFVSARASAADILLLTLVTAAGLPLLLWFIEQVPAVISRKAAAALHAIFVFALLAICLCRVFSAYLDLPAGAAMGAAALLSLCFMVLKQRATWPGKLLSILFPLALIAPLFFLFSGGVYSQLFPKTRAAYVQHAEGKPAIPVVMLIFDEFPLNVLLDKNREIDALRFPNFAALSKQAHWFKNATAINQFTPLAVPAILAGRFPASTRQLPTVETYPLNLFTALAGTHKMKVYEPFTRLCPPELCSRPGESVSRSQRLESMFADLGAIVLNIALPHDQAFVRVPDIDGKWGDFWSEDEQEWEPPNFSRDRRAAEFQKFISSLTADADPTLYFAHVVLPHMPYQFMPSGRAYKKSGPHAYIGNRWADDAPLIQVAYQQFLLQTAAVDGLLGRLIARLKEVGMYDQALIVVAADHGMSFQVGTYRRGHPQHESFYEDILNVPLFMKLPFQKEGIVNEGNAETIDILPTILDVLKLDPLQQTESRSLLSTAPPRSKKQVLIGRVPEGRSRRSDSVANWGVDMAGSTVDFDAPREFPHATLDWKYRLPGYDTPNPANIYFIGPYSELIGKQVSSFAAAAPASAELQFFDRRGPLDKNGNVTFKKNSGQCPCSFSGSLIGDAKQGMVVGAAVNGTLQSFGELMISQGTAHPHFSFFISDAAFQDGENRVEFFLVRSTQQGLELAPLKVRAAS